MRVRLISRPQPPSRTSCDVCELPGRRYCLRFTIPAQDGLTSERVLDVCASCVREAKRIATTGRSRSRS